MQNLFSRFKQNLVRAFAERSLMTVLQIISSILLIKFLSADEYGILGITNGYLALISFINITPENVILRDYDRIKNKIGEHIYVYKIINYMKSGVMIIVLMPTAYLLASGYGSPLFYWAVAALGSQLIAESCTSVYTVVLATQFRQGLILKVRFIRALVTLLITAFFPLFPSLAFVMIRDVSVSLLMIGVWTYVGKSHLALPTTKVTTSTVRRILRRSLVSYSFWTHVNAVANNIYYRMDTIILSFFAPLKLVGHYSVVLNLVNFFGDFFSQMLNYQAAIAISRAVDSLAEWLVGFFSRVLLVTMVIAGFMVIAFGKPLIGLLIKSGASGASEAYSYLVPIFLGVFFSRFVLAPATTWICLKQSIMKYCMRVALPVLLLSVPVFALMGWLLGALGVAWAKFAVGLVAALLIRHLTKQYGLVIQHNPLLLLSDYQKIKEMGSVKEAQLI